MRLAAFVVLTTACSAPSYGFADASVDQSSEAAPPPLKTWCDSETSNTLCASGSASLSFFDPDDGNCYVWFCGSNVDQKVGWHTAKDHCAGLYGGTGHLVFFESDQEFSNVKQWLGTAGGSKLWIGMAASVPAGPYYWVDGTAVTLNDWVSGAPGAVGSCVYLDAALGLWTNAACGDDNSHKTTDATAFHNFVCEVDP